jgi:hypothetical protein
MRGWRFGVLWTVVAAVALAFLALGCESDDDKDKDYSGGGHCAELVDAWLANCAFTLEDENGQSVDDVTALNDCVDHWDGFWDCLWGCYTSTLSCEDFGQCGQGC